jgi:hypothetical protein
MKNFLKITRESILNRARNYEVIPMTVFNLVYDDTEKIEKVFIHEFVMQEVVNNEERLEAINNCIRGSEWESNQLGLKNLCTVYCESMEKDGNPCLYIQVKEGKKNEASLYVFQGKAMQVNKKGELIIDYDEICYICDMNENIDSELL